jgi:hypothetical protein
MNETGGGDTADRDGEGKGSEARSRNNGRNLVKYWLSARSVGHSSWSLLGNGPQQQISFVRTSQETNLLRATTFCY